MIKVYLNKEPDFVEKLEIKTNFIDSVDTFILSADIAGNLIIKAKNGYDEQLHITPIDKDTVRISAL